VTIDAMKYLAEVREENAAKGRKKHNGPRIDAPPTVPSDNSYSDVLNAVHEFVGRFVAYPSAAAHDAHVLWIAHTHWMDAWESTPRLAFLSPEPASGKTRAIEVTELLVPNPVEAVNVTPAYLFPKVGDDDGKPTILYDEIDTVFGPKAKENEEIRGLLNAGHRRGAVAGRCVVRGKTVETEEISAFCAVALAGLGWLPDTILTRSVVVRMRRRAPNEKVMAFRRRVHASEGHDLQQRLAVWASKPHLAAMTAARPEMPAGIEDRNADVWEPLLAVADEAGGDWPQRARDAAVALVGSAAEAEPSLGIRLLADLRTVLGNSEALATAVVLAALIDLPESPWGDLKGKPINDRRLATRLREYGIKSRNVRIGDKIAKGYARDDFHDAWERYLPPSSAGEALQTLQASQGRKPGHFSRSGREDVADRERYTQDERYRNSPTNSNSVAHVAAVADGSGIRGDDPGDPPPDCRRCWHCNGNGSVNEVALSDRTVWLHRKCEAPWMERNR
jgi:hypothetical protein